MPFLASAVRASDPFPATSVGAPEISVSGNFCATKLSAGKLILDRGHFRERLRVVCGRECLAGATGITRLTRGGQNARNYRLEVLHYGKRRVRLGDGPWPLPEG